MRGILLVVLCVSVALGQDVTEVEFCDCSGSCGDGTNCYTFPFNECVQSVNLCTGSPASEYIKITGANDNMDVTFYSDSGCSTYIDDRGTECTETLCVEYPTFEYPTVGFEAYISCTEVNGTNDDCTYNLAFYNDRDDCSGGNFCENDEPVTTENCRTYFIDDQRFYVSANCTEEVAHIYTDENCQGQSSLIDSEETCVDLGDYSVQIWFNRTCEENSGDGEDDASILSSILFF